jgi:phosphatidylinositol-3-phosphatase
MARNWHSGSIAVALVAVLLLAGAMLLGSQIVRRSQHLTNLEPIPSGSNAAVRPMSAVFLIVLENKSEGDIIGSPDAPYLNELIDRFGLATDYQAIAHPSQPNYLAMFSGSTHDVLDDEVSDVAAPNLADQLEDDGQTWRVYAENIPVGGCFTGATANGGRDGDGMYVRKHNPAISFTSISGSPERCANIQPFATFDPGGADFELIVPNMCHIMHDCPVSSGDAWLRRFVPEILDSPAWRDGGVLFITFDEGAESSSRNEVPMLVIASDVPAGFRSGIAHNHYSLLRTIELGLGLDCLAESCSANTMGEFFTTSPE